MNYTKITIITNYTDEESAELLMSTLTDLGAEGFEISGGNELNGLIDNTDPDMIDREVIQQREVPLSVTVYIPDNEQGENTVRSVKDELHRQNLEYTTGGVAEEDWANNWKQYFKPIETGKRLAVKPVWDSYNNTDNRLILEIDPSGAFGTGQHATTMLCLELLEKVIDNRQSVIDVGCGSGILAAAAMLLGAKTVTAVDICETATRVTAETLKLNNIDDYRIYCGNIITDVSLREKIGSGTVTVANITADVIIAMADIFPLLCEETLILSGIILPRLNEVLDVIGKDFDVVEKRECDGWCGLILKKI